MKHRWMFGATVAAFVLAAPAATQARRPSFQVDVVAPQDPESVRVRGWMEQTHLFPFLEQGLNRWVRMPRPVTLRALECATSDVRWVPEQAAVEVCYRMVVRVAGRLTGPDSVAMGRYPAMVFFALHGAAHAVIDELDLPTPAGEEQAVDEVMALMMVPLGSEGGAFMLRSMRTLHRLDPGWEEWEWVRTHRLTPARLEGIACLAHGANPAVFRDYLQGGLLPAARARGCAAEYGRVYNGLGRRITRHLN